jgi:hypothetical protein
VKTGYIHVALTHEFITLTSTPLFFIIHDEGRRQNWEMNAHSASIAEEKFLVRPLN